MEDLSAGSSDSESEVNDDVDFTLMNQKKRKRHLDSSLDSDLICEIRELWKAGTYNKTEISRLLSVTLDTVRYHVAIIEKHPTLTGSSMPERMRRKHIVSAAEKAIILDTVKSRDFNMDSVTADEFAGLVHDVRKEHLHEQNKTSDHLKELSYKTLNKLKRELVPENIKCPTLKNRRRAEALNDLPSAISQVAVSFAIQDITLAKQKEQQEAIENSEKLQNNNCPLRIIPELYFNFDFVTCMMGNWDNAKILLTEGSTKFLNHLNISPGISQELHKKRSIKLLFISNAAGYVVGAIAFIKDYNINCMEKYKLSNQQRALWLNKEWAIKRRIQIELERQMAEREKAEKLTIKAINKAVEVAVSSDPGKQPIVKAYKDEENADYVFCGSNACRNIRKECSAAVDDKWRGCPTNHCTFWVCPKLNCQRQMKSHIEKCLFNLTFKRINPFPTSNTRRLVNKALII